MMSRKQGLKRSARTLSRLITKNKLEHKKWDDQCLIHLSVSELLLRNSINFPRSFFFLMNDVNIEHIGQIKPTTNDLQQVMTYE